jgi:heme exporter protein A
MTQPPAAIQAQQLSKAFGGRPVLDALDLEIPTGQCVALSGANGAGKTTLLRCLATLLRPDGGEVRWFGRPAGRDAALRRWIGMVSHESGLYSHLSLAENLAFAARMTGVDDARRRTAHWLEMTGLMSWGDALPAHVSRGMRQRLAVARALIHDPPLLLLDEPFSGLDANGRQWLLRLLADLRNRGRTICFVTHEDNTIRQLAHRVVELRQGKTCDAAATEEENYPALRAA